MKVQLIHGKEGHPRGRKAQLLDAHFELCCPSMDTDDFEAATDAQAKALSEFTPDVLVGSSFGGAVACELLRRDLWRGPTLLLACAAWHYDHSYTLPAAVPVVLVHGVHDELFPVEHSHRLAATSPTPEMVSVVEVDDDHALRATVDGEHLIAYVRQVASMPMVRPFDAACDREAVIELWREAFGYSEARNDPARVLNDKLAHDPDLLLVAHRAGQLVGTIMAGYDGHRGWLYRAAVKPDVRGLGVGRLLVHHAEQALQQQGCPKINLQIHPDNDRAQGFWAAMGYDIEPRVSMGKTVDGDNDGGC